VRIVAASQKAAAAGCVMGRQVTRPHDPQLRVAPGAAHHWASGPGLCFSVSALYTMPSVLM